ncbi:hypothetical protein DIPPA_35153 [Diplonema papillatum]|nr:hypothetical protein DIPPA_35153 [Diplonema papillatum]
MSKPAVSFGVDAGRLEQQLGAGGIRRCEAVSHGGEEEDGDLIGDELAGPECADRDLAVALAQWEAQAACDYEGASFDEDETLVKRAVMAGKEMKFMPGSGSEPGANLFEHDVPLEEAPPPPPPMHAASVERQAMSDINPSHKPGILDSEYRALRQQAARDYPQPDDDTVNAPQPEQPINPIFRSKC